MDRCPAQDERQDMLGRGHLTNPLEGGGGRGVPVRGGSCSGGLLLANQAVLCVAPSSSDPAAA